MREIKFRAVMQRDDKTFYVSDGYSIDNGLSYLFDFENNRWDIFLEMITTESRFNDMFQDEYEHLKGWCHIKNLQSTGLFDKNGVEIYEGDICKADIFDSDNKEWIGVVEYNSFGGLCLFYNKCRSNMDKSLQTPIQDPQNAIWIQNNCEVIGNIYENKELLND